MKAFVKLLVTSAAYRQSSQVTPELLERDPDNRLLARGPRFRLAAEMVRDQALAVSGLLSPKMYGPPVKPPQPTSASPPRSAAASTGRPARARTSTAAACTPTGGGRTRTPSMATFDAPNRDVCTSADSRTNTPLQALVTLNDPVYVEAAQALARRIAASGPTAPDKARFAFRLPPAPPTSS